MCRTRVLPCMTRLAFSQPSHVPFECLVVRSLGHLTSRKEVQSHKTLKLRSAKQSASPQFSDQYRKQINSLLRLYHH